MILIALGSNMNGPWGTPRQAVLRAVLEMQRHNMTVINVSTPIETAPYGVTNQPNFVNAVAQIKTSMPPETLLHALHMIEKRAGRKRLKRWGPRSLDLDVLDYHGQIRKPVSLSIKPLRLPHPGIVLRSFVLEPIREIAPRWKHPLTHQTAQLMLDQLNRLNGN